MKLVQLGRLQTSAIEKVAKKEKLKNDLRELLIDTDNYCVSRTTTDALVEIALEVTKANGRLKNSTLFIEVAVELNNSYEA